MGERTRKPARRSGWRQWKADEARRVVEAWRASGLPLATFARKRGLCAERVRWWRQRLGGWSSPSEEAQRFIPATVTGFAPTTAGAVVTVRAPGEVVVEVADVGAVPAEWLSALVRELARSTR
jgi:hypothetical protein